MTEDMPDNMQIMSREEHERLTLGDKTPKGAHRRSNVPRITAAQQIKYDPPLYQVDIIGDPEDDDGLGVLNRLPWQVIERDPLGWGEYNRIIRTDWGGGTYFLARVED
jgi:hypothetical protein